MLSSITNKSLNNLDSSIVTIVELSVALLTATVEYDIFRNPASNFLFMSLYLVNRHLITIFRYLDILT